MINNYVYIGKTKRSIRQRYYDHVSSARHGVVYPLYIAMREYGISNFRVDLVEDNIPDEIADEREQYYIKLYNSCVTFPDCRGYNATIGGAHGTSKEYDVDAIIKEYQSGKLKIEISRKYGINTRTLRDLLQKHGVPLRDDTMWEAKEIQQIDCNTGDVVAVYDSILGAARALGLKSHARISEAVNHKRYKAHGYRWEYV